MLKQCYYVHRQIARLITPHPTWFLYLSQLTTIYPAVTSNQVLSKTVWVYSTFHLHQAFPCNRINISLKIRADTINRRHTFPR